MTSSEAILPILPNINELYTLCLKNVVPNFLQ